MRTKDNLRFRCIEADRTGAEARIRCTFFFNMATHNSKRRFGMLHVCRVCKWANICYLLYNATVSMLQAKHKHKVKKKNLIKAETGVGFHSHYGTTDTWKIVPRLVHWETRPSQCYYSSNHWGPFIPEDSALSPAPPVLAPVTGKSQSCLLRVLLSWAPI